MKFKLEIDTALFAELMPHHEIAKILHQAAWRVDYYGLGTPATALFDSNGNKAGQWEATE